MQRKNTILIIFKTAVVVPQQSAYVVESLGKYSRTLRAGFHILQQRDVYFGDPIGRGHDVTCAIRRFQGKNIVTTLDPRPLNIGPNGHNVSWMQGRICRHLNFRGFRAGDHAPLMPADPAAVKLQIE